MEVVTGIEMGELTLRLDKFIKYLFKHWGREEGRKIVRDKGRKRRR